MFPIFLVRCIISPRPDVSAERKTQILKAATRVFLLKGLGAARMEDIAQEAGLSIGGVYWYYKSKEEIILGLFESIFDPDIQDMEQLVQEPGPSREKLERCLLATVAVDQRLRPLVFEVYNIACRDERIQRRLQNYFTAYQGLFSEIIQQGIAREEIRPVNTQAIVLSLLALYEGALNFTMLNDERVDPRTILMQSLELLVDGLFY